MKNLFIAKILYEIADILEIQNVLFKPRAYRNAARNIESLSIPIEEVKDLRSIPGVGEAIEAKIQELLITGKLKYFEELKKQMPFDYESLMKVEGMGPKKIKHLYDALGVKTVSDLKNAAKSGKIKDVPGFGEKSEEKILESISLVKNSSGRRMLLFNALNIADDIVKKLRPYSKEITYAGSLRRMKEDIGDLDILAVSKDKRLISTFMSFGEKIAQGPTKCSIHLPDGIQVDLRIIKEESYGAALQYFTGSKAHNVEVRKIAIRKGLKLNEYGLYKDNKLVAGRTEKEVYDSLGLLTVPAEMRENTGELQLKKIPEVITYDSIKGDLQMHTDFSDGASTAEEMIQACVNKKYEYMGLTDHVSEIGITNPLSPERIKKQAGLIKVLQKKYPQIKVLHGLEVDVLRDGSLYASKKVLESVDFVIASVHNSFRESSNETTQRLIKALSYPNVKILGHPTGRLLGEREGITYDLERVFSECKDKGVFLEVNAEPKRLDLNDVNVRLAMNLDCNLIINTDAHSPHELDYMRLGIGTALRGWATKDLVFNTRSLKDFSKNFLD